MKMANTECCMFNVLFLSLDLSLDNVTCLALQ
uniref:Uncharacterized protein n=1 Tax=Anguilla anguilla TaxID=7936 RepID=A0A0E9QG04_ANGAN